MDVLVRRISNDIVFLFVGLGFFFVLLLDFLFDVFGFLGSWGEMFVRERLIFFKCWRV